MTPAGESLRSQRRAPKEHDSPPTSQASGPHGVGDSEARSRVHPDTVRAPGSPIRMTEGEGSELAPGVLA